MSRRFATLADLMTGRGGVHEVSARRLVPVAVADLEGVDRLSSEAVLEAGPSGAGGDARDAAASPSRHFESHVEYVLPVASAGAPPRSLHVLRLLPAIEANLRAELLPRARANARRGYDAMERLVWGPDAGVTVSNVGGYQSAHDVLEPDTWSDSDEEDGEEEDGKEEDGKEEDGKEEDGEERLPRDAAVVDVEPAATRACIKGWGMLSEVACAAHDRVRDRAMAERSVTRDDLYGWLNCNAPGDYNKLHDHGGAESWSGVYYLQCPAPVKPASSDSDSDSEWDEAEDERAFGAGALGLRCHVLPDDASEGGDWSDGDWSNASVPYLRFQPRVGDLIVFRGDVLHAVESNGWARSGEGRGDPADADVESMRMSVAFNEDSAAADRKAALALAA